MTVAETPNELGWGFGSLWVVCHRSAEVDRVDPTTGKILARITAKDGDAGIGIAIAAGHVWFLEGKSENVYGIDPKTNTISVTVPVHIDGGSFAPDGSSVWFGGADGTLRRIDATGKVTAMVKVGTAQDFETPWVMDGKVYSTESDKNDVAVVDEKTLEPVAHWPLKGDLGGIVSGFGSLWVGAFSGPLYRLDPATGKVQATIKVPATDHIVPGETKLWLRETDLKIVSVDPKTNQVGPGFAIEHAEIPGGGTLPVRNHLWLANWSYNTIWDIPTTT